jgi:hypothetical protein
VEIIIFIAVLGLVDWLAMRFGYDSRPTVQSKDRELATS